ncbi:CPBP family intramembrane glutamic endopeptidase [uncultured Dokdonia sp.]|uniref:CPBP family intramembrane glutamic endopeptidase n=1 Tax=uncultured Dokdonia sp. TaxID=575653 RepID=UPI002626C842|nr:CPBP family intramembrane glutamic endopeptidase [uncultured Dokdonia sp.]
MEETPTPINYCLHCSASLPTIAKFCSQCGTSVIVPVHKGVQKSVYYIIAFYLAFLLLAIINVAVFSNGFSFLSEVVVEAIFILMTLGFCLLDWKNIMKLYQLPHIEVKGVLMMFLVPIGSAFLVYYGIEWLNDALGWYDENIFGEYIRYKNTLFWAILFTAILPPIFEELAFRGFLFNEMRKVSSVQVTIIATSFLFALVHFSFISFIWIFPFGLFLGYLRQRYNTLWLSMVVHFIHNFIVLMLDYAYFNPNILEAF